MRLAEDFDFARHQEDLTDELADPDKVAGAILISDPALLLHRATPEEREKSEWPPENDGFAYPAEAAERNAIHDELGGLQRVIVLVEGSAEDPLLVGNCRVHGLAQSLREALWTATGILPRDPRSPSEDSELFEQGLALQGRTGSQASPLS